MTQAAGPLRLAFRTLPGVLALVFLAIGAVFALVSVFTPEQRGAFLPVGLLGLALGGGLAARGWVKARRLLRLARTGRSVTGRALGWTVTPVRIGYVAQYRLKFEVTGPDGVRREGWSGYAPPEKIVSIEAGAPVEVLVDPEDPATFALARDLAR
ncbi:MAG: DUF3592 domain-containing protein [Pseudomonadota bacterium]